MGYPNKTNEKKTVINYCSAIPMVYGFTLKKA